MVNRQRRVDRWRPGRRPGTEMTLALTYSCVDEGASESEGVDEGSGCRLYYEFKAVIGFECRC